VNVTKYYINKKNTKRCEWKNRPRELFMQMLHSTINKNIQSVVSERMELSNDYVNATQYYMEVNKALWVKESS
jgi:hypothetical protein